MSSAKVLHKKTDVSGRIPQASDTDFGEIAINYNTDDKGTIFTKLSDGTSMASFRSESYNDNKYISKSEGVPQASTELQEIITKCIDGRSAVNLGVLGENWINELPNAFVATYNGRQSLFVVNKSYSNVVFTATTPIRDLGTYYIRNCIIKIEIQYGYGTGSGIVTEMIVFNGDGSKFLNDAGEYTSPISEETMAKINGISTLSSSTIAINEKIDTLSGNVIANELVVSSSLNDLNEKLNLKVNKDDLTTITETVNELKTTSDTNVTEISQLKSKISELEQSIQDILNSQSFVITLSLTNCTSSNNNLSVRNGNSWTTTISADSGYGLGSITVTMGANDITSQCVNLSTGEISINSVSGNIVITAIGEKQVGSISGLRHFISPNENLASGTYTLYYEDENHQKLDGWNAIGTITSDNSN